MTTKTFDQYELAGLLTKMVLLAPVGGVTANTRGRRQITVDVCRSYLGRDDKAGFIDYIQESLAGPNGDYMTDFLDDLFQEVGLPDGACWEDFEALLAF